MPVTENDRNDCIPGESQEHDQHMDSGNISASVKSITNCVTLSIIVNEHVCRLECMFTGGFVKQCLS